MTKSDKITEFKAHIEETEFLVNEFKRILPDTANRTNWIIGISTGMSGFILSNIGYLNVENPLSAQLLYWVSMLLVPFVLFIMVFERYAIYKYSTAVNEIERYIELIDKNNNEMKEINTRAKVLNEFRLILKKDYEKTLLKYEKLEYITAGFFVVGTICFFVSMIIIAFH